MSWFRKDISKELRKLLKDLGIKKAEISKDWEWRSRKLKHLNDLEETDIRLIRDIQILQKYSRDNPELSTRIIYLAGELKKDIEQLIGLVKLQTNVPKEKIELAKKMTGELEILLKAEIEEERLIPGMTREQAERLGIKVVSFYTVQDKQGVKRTMHGEGDWPLSPTKAHLGPGVYAWDNIEAAERYRNNIIENAVRNNEPKPKLFIMRITFSRSSLKKFNPFDVDLLDNFKISGAQEWMERHSLLWMQNAKRHGYKYIIRGVSAGLGKEHYFRPDCLEEAAVEIVA